MQGPAFRPVTLLAPRTPTVFTPALPRTDGCCIAEITVWIVLQVAGVRVSLFQHSLEHGTPDAVFPNNWFTTHPAGEAAGGVAESTLALYPLKCPNRCARIATVLAY